MLGVKYAILFRFQFVSCFLFLFLSLSFFNFPVGYLKVILEVLPSENKARKRDKRPIYWKGRKTTLFLEMAQL